MGFGLLYWQNYLFWLLKYVKVLYGSLGLYDCFLSKDKKKLFTLLCLSLPAKSTKFSFPTLMWSPFSFELSAHSITIVKIEWDLDEVWFIRVAPKISNDKHWKGEIEVQRNREIKISTVFAGWDKKGIEKRERERVAEREAEREVDREREREREKKITNRWIGS